MQLTGSSIFGPFRAPKISPNEFEPFTPKYDPTRQTTFTDFIKKGQEAPSPLTPRSAHVKNARSEDNAMRMGTASIHLADAPTKSSGHPLHRSESSPNVSQLPFAPRHNATSSSDIFQYYTAAREANSPARRGRQVSKECTPRGGQNIGVQYGSLSPSRRSDSAQESPSRSPTQHVPQASLSKGNTTNRNVARSRTETLGDVSERDEFDDSLPNRSSNTGPSGYSTPSSSKKRSRSPMKKMFGENGWLGKSPDEKPDLKLPSKRKVVGMMEKLKNKFEEIVSS
jgi:hypothetical protein